MEEQNNKHQLKAPFIPPDYSKLLSIQPQVLLNSGDVQIIQPVLDQLIYGDFSQLKDVSYHKQLFQLCQLLQFSCQYFMLAQDHYASQCDTLNMKTGTLISQNMTLNQQLLELQQKLQAQKLQPEPTPAFILQSQKLQAENIRLKQENQRLKMHLKEILPVISQLPQCDFCQKRFSNYNVLAQHVLRRHPQNWNLWQKYNENNLAGVNPNTIEVNSRSPLSRCPPQTASQNDYSTKSSQVTKQILQNSNFTDDAFEVQQPQKAVPPQLDDYYVAFNQRKIDQTGEELAQMINYIQNHDEQKIARQAKKQQNAIDNILNNSKKPENQNNEQFMPLNPQLADNRIVKRTTNDISIDSDQTITIQQVPQIESPYKREIANKFPQNFSEEELQKFADKPVPEQLDELKKRIDAFENDSFSTIHDTSKDKSPIHKINEFQDNSKDNDSFSIYGQDYQVNQNNQPSKQSSPLNRKSAIENPNTTKNSHESSTIEQIPQLKKPFNISFASEPTINSELIDQVENMIQQMQSFESNSFI